jgi:hypothetical protein
MRSSSFNLDHQITTLLVRSTPAHHLASPSFSPSQRITYQSTPRDSLLISFLATSVEPREPDADEGLRGYRVIVCIEDQLIHISRYAQVVSSTSPQSEQSQQRKVYISPPQAVNPLEVLRMSLCFVFFQAWSPELRGSSARFSTKVPHVIYHLERSVVRSV